MDPASIMSVFNAVMTAFSPAISVIVGVVVASSVLVWIIKRLS